MKTERLRQTGVVTMLALAGFSAGNNARAALGSVPMSPPADPTTSVRVLQRVANASSQTAGGTAVDNGLTVRETTFGSDTVVREYLDPTGRVYGVAWQGPVKPNLPDLLGDYFHQYAAEVRRTRSAHGMRAPVSIASQELVVRVGGHMGAFNGQAWLPAALPAGVTGDAIR